MSTGLKILFASLIIVIAFLSFETFNKSEANLDNELSMIRDSLSDFYENKYRTIDSLEIKQEIRLKYRYKTFKHYDTIIINIPFISLDSAFASYKEL